MAMLVQLDELEAQGKGRAAASIVAKRMSRNPRDPGEVEVLTQHLRRIRRRHNKTSNAR
jgi:hypothetical protein